ncbi:hypothetical protein ACFQZT_33905 [Paenibacillus sp. GCM10027628]
MKKTILIFACLGTILLTITAFAKSDDQSGFKTQTSVADAVYGKGEILK